MHWKNALLVHLGVEYSAAFSAELQRNFDLDKMAHTKWCNPNSKKVNFKETVRKVKQHQFLNFNVTSWQGGLGIFK